MNSASSNYVILQQDMILSVRKPENIPASGLTILLHGWTGDENSMNGFWQYLPKNHWLLSPRAPQTASPSGYAWAQITPNMYPEYDKLLPSVEKLLSTIVHFKQEHGLRITTMNIVGFSQGAAVAYMLAALIPDEINLIISIAGFIPNGTLEILSLHLNRNPKIRIFHGALDKLVPVELAKQSEKSLSALGFDTKICIDENTGHKMGPSCAAYLMSLKAE